METLHDFITNLLLVLGGFGIGYVTRQLQARIQAEKIGREIVDVMNEAWAAIKEADNN